MQPFAALCMCLRLFSHTYPEHTCCSYVQAMHKAGVRVTRKEATELAQEVSNAFDSRFKEDREPGAHTRPCCCPCLLCRAAISLGHNREGGRAQSFMPVCN